jgi:transposase
MEETGECGERQLNHSDGEAERFYRDLKQRGIHVRVGMEATGYSRWFERLLAELGFELWIGDPATIKTKRVKKRKFDREDARLLLRLMREDDFPQFGYPARRIEICDNCCGTDIALRGVLCGILG